MARSDSYQRQELETPTGAISGEPSPKGLAGTEVVADVHPAVTPGLKVNRFTEKTNLLDGNEELP